MTSEHVSVPRAELETLFREFAGMLGLTHPAVKRLSNAILSRATPIDVCDFCGGDCSSANPPMSIVTDEMVKAFKLAYMSGPVKSLSPENERIRRSLEAAILSRATPSDVPEKT